MFTLDYRPERFSELIGQDTNVYILKSLIKNPAKYPRSLIFQGEYGCGKTTSARLLARALNCKSKKTIEPCLKCEVCKDSLTFTPFYQEFDASTVGNKESMERLKADFFSSSSEGTWRVIVLDEAHLMSREAQSSLLTTLENLPQNIIVILCTTVVEDLLDTIRSRSVELDFVTLSEDEIIKSLLRIKASEGVVIEEEVMRRIARYSRGHVRDAVMAFNLFCNVEEKEAFFEKIRSSELELIKILQCIGSGSGDMSLLLTKICQRPLEMVREDFYIVLRNLVISFAGGYVEPSYSQEYSKLVSLWGKNSLSLFTSSLSDWVVNCFKSDVTLQTFFWSIKSKYSLTTNSREAILNKFSRK